VWPALPARHPLALALQPSDEDNEEDENEDKEAEADKVRQTLLGTSWRIDHVMRAVVCVAAGKAARW
jgi:hypothetical protein